MGVAIGVVIGAILQLVVSVVGLAGLGFDYRFKIYWKNQGFRKVLSLLPTRSADQGLDYVSAMIDTNLASRMVDGTIRAYQQAGTLYNMPINLIGVAISTAAFPQLSDDAGAGDSKKFAQQLRSTLRTIIWLALPTAVGMFFVRGYLVSIIDRGGNGLIATLLGILCIATLLRSIFHLASRSFYAFQDTRTPFRVSLVTLFITVLLELWFVFGLHAGIIGVAWAQVIWALLELIALFTLIMHKVPRLFNVKFLLALLKMVVATACMAAATYTLVRMFNLQFANQNMLIVVAPLLLIVIVSALVYGVASRVLCLEEIQPIIGIVKKVLAGVLSGRQR